MRRVASNGRGQSPFHCSFLSPDSPGPLVQILASGSYDDTIKLYIDDPSDDWFCFSTLTGHTSTVWSIAWSPSGSYLASASDDRTVRVWRRVAEHKWDCVLVLEGHERSVYSVSWGPGKGNVAEGNLGWIASVGGDGVIYVWELAVRFLFSVATCLSLIFRSIQEPSKSDNSTTSKNPPTYKLITRLPSAHGVHDVNTVVWCPRKGYEDLLATAGDDGVARVWKVSCV